MADALMGLDPSLAGWGDPTFDPGSPSMWSTTPMVTPGLDPSLINGTGGASINPNLGSGWWNADPTSPDFFSNMNLGPLGNFTHGLSSLWDGASNVINGMLPSGSNTGSLIPGAMALTYAAAQPNLDLSQLNAISGQLAGNQNALVKAATDPLQRNIAAGYGDLLQSQALRGIRGSSFGDTDIANYISDTSNALSNAGANAAQGSLALQGELASQIAALQNQRQQTKNRLFGTAFDVLGRGMNPQGYTNSINIGVGGGGTSAPTANKNSGIGALLGGGAGLLLGGPAGGGIGAMLGGTLGGLL